jgi:putative effector of murein hydrolase LrgA (UPF0299 family)
VLHLDFLCKQLVQQQRPMDAVLQRILPLICAHVAACSLHARYPSLSTTLKPAPPVLLQLQTAMVSTGTELKQLVVDVAAAGSGMSAKDVTAQLPAAPAAPASSSSGGSLGAIVLQRAQLLISLASLYYLDQGIKVLFTQYAIKFPSALAGMFGVFALLCVVGDKTADKILGWYNPALNWIARWLPLFYVPALVTLPLALNGIPGACTAALLHF